MNPEFPEHVAGRIPVTPVALMTNDRILAIHTEGETDEVVDWWVTDRSEDRAEGGRTVVTITYRDAGAPTDEDAGPLTREFCDPKQWLSLAFPTRRHASTAPAKAAA